MPARAAPDPRRRLLLGLAHKGAVQLGLDDDARRAAQLAYTGSASCRDMSDTTLIGWCWELKRRGASIGIPAPRPDAGQYGHVTASQWAEIERLAVLLGWEDRLDAPALRAFVKRSFGIDDPRFLSNRQATGLIAGLRRWVGGRARKGAA